MKTVALGDYADVFNGKTPSKAEQRDRGHPVLKIRDVDDTGHFRREYKSFVDPDFVAKFQNKSVKAGDTLILNAAHNADYVGSKTFFADSEVEGAIATGEWLIVRPHRSALDARFASHWLTSSTARREIRELVKGIHLYPKDLARLSIPLPPLAEQKRIAAILDQADDLRRKRQRALDRLGQLGQAIFMEMFGDPLLNPLNWKTLELGDLIVDGPQNGIYKHSSHYGSGTPILRIDGFYDGEITKLNSLRRLDLTLEEINTYALEPGNIVINRVNSREYLGKSAIVPSLSEPVVFESNMMRMRIDETRARSKFLIQYLQTSFVRSQIMARTKDAVNQSSINQKDVCSFQVRLPPIEIQDRFIDLVEQISALRPIMISNVVTVESLFHSLQHRAFNGDLTTSSLKEAAP